MRPTRQDRPGDWALLVLLVLVSFMLANDRGIVSEPMSRVVRSVLLPVHAVVNSTYLAATDALLGLRQGSTLRAEVRELRAKAEEAEALRLRLRELELENERLRSIVETLPSLSPGSVAASVIGYYPLESTATLSVGSRHGVRVGAAVVAPKGLVGVVEQVDASTCRVLLNTSDRFAVGARLAGTDSRAAGVARGTGGPNLLLDHLSEAAIVRMGERVVTSGIGQRYPKGILIGTVVRVWRDPAYGFVRAWVAPAVRPDTVEEAIILR
ncbi:MAG: rod shape-determining protein MreC [Fimbriimonadia bacterium]|jgi:rod shape-determining protein MreC